MVLCYQVEIFKGSGEYPINDLQKKMNKFLKKLPVLEGNNKSPSTRLADSGKVAMVIYLTELKD